MKAVYASLSIVLLLLLPSWAAGTSGETGQDSKAKPPAKPQPPPPRRGFDPNDGGGPQKGMGYKGEICAAGRLLKVDSEARKITVRTADEATAVLSYTGKTVVLHGSEPGALDDLGPGMNVTVYCASNGPKDVAVRIRIDRP